MPGIDARAPERTETSKGAVGSPNRAPIDRSTRFSAASDWSHIPGGKDFLLS